jgi:hypothetical protein
VVAAALQGQVVEAGGPAVEHPANVMGLELPPVRRTPL